MSTYQDEKFRKELSKVLSKIDNMSKYHLARAIIQKQFEKIQHRDATERFRIGDLVEFELHGGKHRGIALRINRKTITVEERKSVDDKRGTVWRVTPTLLKLVHRPRSR